MGINATGIIEGGKQAWDTVIPILDPAARWLLDSKIGTYINSPLGTFIIAALLIFLAYKGFGDIMKGIRGIIIAVLIVILVRALTMI